MQTFIDAKILKGMACLAGEADIRPEVNGVWLLARAHDLVLMASDGIVGGMYQVYKEGWNEPFRVRIPPHVLVALKSARGTVSFSSDDGALWKAENFDTSVTWQHVLEQRPFELQRVLPKNASGTPGHYNVDALVKFAKARKAFGMKPRACGVLWVHNGDSATRVHLDDVPEFVGVIQALRPTEVPACPDWLDGAAPAEECDLV